MGFTRLNEVHKSSCFFFEIWKVVFGTRQVNRTGFVTSPPNGLTFDPMSTKSFDTHKSKWILHVSSLWAECVRGLEYQGKTLGQIEVGYYLCVSCLGQNVWSNKHLSIFQNGEDILCILAGLLLSSVINGLLAVITEFHYFQLNTWRSYEYLLLSNCHRCRVVHARLSSRWPGFESLRIFSALNFGSPGLTHTWVISLIPRLARQ